MEYKGKPVLHHITSPSELFFITASAAPAIGKVLLELSVYNNLPMASETTVLDSALDFCALCAVRANEVVNFDCYQGQFFIDQFDSYEIEWRTISGDAEREFHTFLEASYDAQESGTQLNFIDLILQQACREYVTAMADSATPLPMIDNLLYAEPSIAELVKVIDLALYSAGAPLTTERYQLEGAGGVKHTWQELEPFGEPSDTGLQMGDQVFERFRDMRSSPFDLPPNLSSQVYDDTVQYRILLIEES